MWIELLISAPSAFAAYKGRHVAVKGLRKVPLIKSALPAPPVQKPTMILCELLALEIIKDIPYVWDRRDQDWRFKGYTVQFRTDYEFSGGVNRFPMGKEGKTRDWWLEFDSLSLSDPKGNYVSLLQEEKTVLMAAIAKACLLYGKKTSIQNEESRQERALAAIEHIMGITPKEDCLVCAEYPTPIEHTNCTRDKRIKT